MDEVDYRCSKCGKHLKGCHAKGNLEKIGTVNKNGKYNISDDKKGKFQFTFKCPGCPTIYGFNVAA